MTRPSLREYAAVQRERYLAATRAEKGALLNEVVAVTGLHRKAAIRLLRRAPRAPTARSRAGRPLPHRRDAGSGALDEEGRREAERVRVIVVSAARASGRHRVKRARALILSSTYT